MVRKTLVVLFASAFISHLARFKRAPVFALQTKPTTVNYQRNGLMLNSRLAAGLLRINMN